MTKPGFDLVTGPHTRQVPNRQEPNMKIQLVHFDGCPNVVAARAALSRCLTSLGLPPEYEEVNTDAADAPEALREWGSPTILVDGIDVGGEPKPNGTSCRLYDNPDNRGVPSDGTISAALRREWK